MVTEMNSSESMASMSAMGTESPHVKLVVSLRTCISQAWAATSSPSQWVKECDEIKRQNKWQSISTCTFERTLSRLLIENVCKGSQPSRVLLGYLREAVCNIISPFNFFHELHAYELETTNAAVFLEFLDIVHTFLPGLSVNSLVLGMLNGRDRSQIQHLMVQIVLKTVTWLITMPTKALASCDAMTNSNRAFVGPVIVKTWEDATIKVISMVTRFLYIPRMAALLHIGRIIVAEDWNTVKKHVGILSRHDFYSNHAQRSAEVQRVAAQMSRVQMELKRALPVLDAYSKCLDHRDGALPWWGNVGEVSRGRRRHWVVGDHLPYEVLVFVQDTIVSEVHHDHRVLVERWLKKTSLICFQETANAHISQESASLKHDRKEGGTRQDIHAFWVAIVQSTILGVQASVEIADYPHVASASSNIFGYAVKGLEMYKIYKQKWTMWCFVTLPALVALVHPDKASLLRTLALLSRVESITSFRPDVGEHEHDNNGIASPNLFEMIVQSLVTMGNLTRDDATGLGVRDPSGEEGLETLTIDDLRAVAANGVCQISERIHAGLDTPGNPEHFVAQARNCTDLVVALGDAPGSPENMMILAVVLLHALASGHLLGLLYASGQLQEVVSCLERLHRVYVDQLPLETEVMIEAFCVQAAARFEGITANLAPRPLPTIALDHVASLAKALFNSGEGQTWASSVAAMDPQTIGRGLIPKVYACGLRGVEEEYVTVDDFVEGMAVVFNHSPLSLIYLALRGGDDRQLLERAMTKARTTAYPAKAADCVEDTMSASVGALENGVWKGMVGMVEMVVVGLRRGVLKNFPLLGAGQLMIGDESTKFLDIGKRILEMGRVSAYDIAVLHYSRYRYGTGQVVKEIVDMMPSFEIGHLELDAIAEVVIALLTVPSSVRENGEAFFNMVLPAMLNTLACVGIAKALASVAVAMAVGLAQVDEVLATDMIRHVLHVLEAVLAHAGDTQIVFCKLFLRSMTSALPLLVQTATVGNLHVLVWHTVDSSLAFPLFKIDDPECLTKCLDFFATEQVRLKD